MDNKIRDAFQEIRAKEALKQHTKDYLSREIYHKTVVKRHRWMKWMTAAACLVLVLFGGWMLYFIPVTTVSVDVNPSLELGINRFDRVVTIEGYNEDGQALVKELDVRYMTYTDALNAILDADAMASYLDNDGDVSITVAGENAEICSRMLENVAAYVAEGRTNIYCHQGDAACISQAHENGLSVGKYMAFQRLQELDPDINVEDVAGLSMKEIRQWIQELENGQSGSAPQLQEESVGSPAAESGRHGEGHGNGKQQKNRKGE